VAFHDEGQEDAAPRRRSFDMEVGRIALAIVGPGHCPIAFRVGSVDIALPTASCAVRDGKVGVGGDIAPAVVERIKCLGGVGYLLTGGDAGLGMSWLPGS
jgi:hypothetical protein